MRRTISKLLFAAAFMTLSSAAFGSTLWIFPSVGPSEDGSFVAYTTNAAAGLEAGYLASPGTTQSAGTADTPGYYQEAGSEINAYALVATSYSSWLGTVPSSSYGANYPSEFGNAVYFGLAMASDTPADTFTLADITFQLNGGDIYSLAGQQFSYNTVGYACTGALMPGDASCTKYDSVTPGSDSTAINYLFTYGFLVSDYSSDPGTLQATAGQYKGLNLNGQYFGPGSSQSSVTSNLVVTPEPGTLALFGLALIGMGIRLRKKN